MLNESDFYKLLYWVMREECFSAKAFWDVDDYSVGFGRHGARRGVTRETEVDLDTATAWCHEDLIEALEKAYTLFPDCFDLTPCRWACLAAMVYQMGYESVKKFSKMLSACNNEDWHEAGWQMLRSHWARVQTPARAMRTADAFAHDAWPDTGLLPAANWQ